jgi:hypothetical protein
VREAAPDDVETIVGILNPVIAARVYAAFDTLWTCARSIAATRPQRGHARTSKPNVRRMSSA